MNSQTAAHHAATVLTGTMATLMAAASVMLATAAGQGFDRYRGPALAMLAHGASAAAGAGVLTVVARRLAMMPARTPRHW